jgi:cytoskeleton protein RodZ
MAMRDEGELRIGEVLKGTRTRLRLDVATVEEQTKIRTKYLRALENEEWDTLPGPTYAKGFLRTYASYLGLDADALVDEYRRAVERSPATEQPYLFSEPLLERRRRPVEPRRRSRGYWLLVVGIVAVLAASVLVAIGLFGGSSDNQGKAHHKGKHHRHHDHGSQGSKHGGQANGSSSGKPVSLALTTHDEMVVCLLPGHGRPLIDSQTLVAGSKEGPFEPAAENYRLDLISGGSVTLVLGGKAQRVHSKRPASFDIDSGGVRPIAYQGQKCP